MRVVGWTVEEATTEEIEIGRMLFTGETRLDGSGAACISCHNVRNDQLIGGGLLAKDLTGVFTRLNEAGIKAMVSNPPFPVMKEAYKSGLVTDQEAFYLTAFLMSADREQYYQHSRNWQHLILIAGSAGFLLLLFIFSYTWRNRRRKKVNHIIYDRQLNSESSLY